MEIDIQTGEKILRKKFTSYYTDEEITGMLYLTNKRLAFSAHPLNYREYIINIPMPEIERVDFKQKLALFPHGILVITTDGTSYNFAVWRRRKWKKEIEKAAHSA
ncbi:MAG: GRAM domain-containing protein [Candidatus Kerfeldbacteria bacterium]